MGQFFDEADLAKMRSIRDVFDPGGLCNPGKALPSQGRCVESGSSRRLPVGH
jgi:glycolate oxidase